MKSQEHTRLRVRRNKTVTFNLIRPCTRRPRCRGINNWKNTTLPAVSGLYSIFKFHRTHRRPIDYTTAGVRKCVDNGCWSSVRVILCYSLFDISVRGKDQRPSCDRRRDKWKIQIDKYRQSNVHERSDGLSGNVHYRDYLLFIQITSCRTIVVITTAVWNTEVRFTLLCLIWETKAVEKPVVARSVDINFSAKRRVRNEFN